MTGPAIVRLVLAMALAFVALPAPAQDPPPPDPAELLASVLGALLGFTETTGPELQREVAEVGGVPFRSDVPLHFLSRAELSSYVRELVDAEYPEARARAEQRTLVALGLLRSGTDLRQLRVRLLEDNVAGFYDDRPGRKRLYAVSDDHRLTPANQLILAHELRHALQDQYVDVHHALPESVGDFDDRRLAYLSLLEGDATLVMERYLLRRIPGAPDLGDSLAGMALPATALPDTPPVLRDQLVLPYLIGRDFAQAVLTRGGWTALREAWARPPQSTEQVLHPDKYFDPEPPRTVTLPPPPAGARLVNDGVLGELLVRTLVGPGSEAAAAGWGGDRFGVWDVGGATLMVWSSEWDAPAEAREFLAAARAAFRARYGPPLVQGAFEVFSGDGWQWAWGERDGRPRLVSSDRGSLLETALRAGGASAAAP